MSLPSRSNPCCHSQRAWLRCERAETGLAGGESLPSRWQLHKRRRIRQRRVWERSRALPLARTATGIGLGQLPAGCPTGSHPAAASSQSPPATATAARAGHFSVVRCCRPAHALPLVDVAAQRGDDRGAALVRHDRRVHCPMDTKSSAGRSRVAPASIVPMSSLPGFAFAGHPRNASIRDSVPATTATSRKSRSRRLRSGTPPVSARTVRGPRGAPPA